MTDAWSRIAALTPPEVFFDRRSFMRAATALGVAPFAAACAQDLDVAAAIVRPPVAYPDGMSIATTPYAVPAGLRTELTPRLTAASHNNYYEFLFGGGGYVWPLTERFRVRPWLVEVTGECAKPRSFDLDDLHAFPQEERLYHFRCVERWAMNVPWIGFPIARLLEQVEPNGHAKYVRFTSAHVPGQMPGLGSIGTGLSWPYQEGLRIDEAMNELALLATGVYGEPLLKQHGAPVRVVVPWKYGYKNPKSIVRIELVRERPDTFWAAGPYGHEYGFLSNVNPNIPHPRWSQEESYWLDTRDRFATPMFNGYGSSVASLYPDEPTTMQPRLRPGDAAR